MEEEIWKEILEIEDSRAKIINVSESKVTRSTRAPVKVKLKFRKSKSSSTHKEHFFQKWSGAGDLSEARTTSDERDDPESSALPTAEKKPPHNSSQSTVPILREGRY